VLNKTDLLPYVDFDVTRFVKDARKLKPGVDVLAMSVRTGAGFESWQDWLRDL
jgi:hydrogenase nickel incorporation protein HypB